MSVWVVEIQGLLDMFSPRTSPMGPGDVPSRTDGERLPGLALFAGLATYSAEVFCLWVHFFPGVGSGWRPKPGVESGIEAT